MPLENVRVVTREHADQVARNLSRSLDDVPGLAVHSTLVGALFGQNIWSIEVSLENGPVLVYTPYELDNGAEGIKDDYLVTIRQAAGQNIQHKPLTHGGPRKYFSDLITLDPIDPEDLDG